MPVLEVSEEMKNAVDWAVEFLRGNATASSSSVGTIDIQEETVTIVDERIFA